MNCAYCAAPVEILTPACPFCGSATLLGDRYEVRSRIGRGGMGEVFRAYDRRLDTDVAVKRLPPQFSSDPVLRESLTREARVMAKLSDAAIVRLFDLEEFAGYLYLILEYVPGPNLSAMIRSGYRATAAELAHILGGVCQGLSAAHATGIVHRDLKPSNILLALSGAQRATFEQKQILPSSLASASVKIADFGIAKAVLESRATFTSEFAGSPGYMAPEQFQGGPISPETDVYALGVLTCELLTGSLPYTRDGSQSGFFDRGRRALPCVQDGVTEVVLQATSQAKAQRFESAEAFYKALAASLEGHALPLRRRPVVPAKKPSAWKFIVAMLAAIFAIGYYPFLFPPKGKPVSSFDRDLAEADPIVEWHTPPPITELPPIVNEARGRLPETRQPGPSKPHVAWTARLGAAMSMRIQAVGVDGTVYLTGMEGICAVRDGEVKWRYKAGPTGASSVKIDDDGRIWFGGMSTTYCVNRDGQGGRLLSTSTLRPRVRTAQSNRVNCLFTQELAGPGWRLPLDGGCTSAGVAMGEDGTAYTATDIPEVLAVRPGGQLAWKAATPCTPIALVAVLPSQAIYACQDRSIHAVSDGRELWRVQADGNLYSNFTADANGTIYYGDFGRQTGATHLHAIDTKGQEVWSVDMKRMTVSGMVLDNQRRLYVSGSFSAGRLLCLTD